MTTRNMFVVFDLDGTLALNEHRQHFVNRPNADKDWDAFFEACDVDRPHWQVIRTLEVFRATGNAVEIWSGRSDAVYSKTIKWLERHGLGGVPIRMRPKADYTPDHELKQQWIMEASRKPDMAFDDRASVVAMWRANGIVCAQVAEGNF